uniref:ATP-binding cassette domain-containing protein n=1 Tax=Salmonella enterica TaxID=28901 RepID=UPI00398C645A
MDRLKRQEGTRSWDGKTQVIQPVPLEVEDGEFSVMVGPSGCGKSTLLRMVAGLERVTSGDIGIERRRVTEIEPKDPGIAIACENSAVYPHLSEDDKGAEVRQISVIVTPHIDNRFREA